MDVGTVVERFGGGRVGGAVVVVVDEDEGLDDEEEDGSDEDVDVEVEADADVDVATDVGSINVGAEVDANDPSDKPIS